MKKETNLLLLFFAGIVIIAVFAIIFFFFCLKNKVDYAELIEVSISNSNGFAAVYDKYTLTRKDGEWVATRFDFREDDAYKVVDDAFVSKVIDILEENKVHKWDGFDRKLTFIYDATSINFYMRFSNGREIQASGYATYPKNFYIVFEEIETLFIGLFGE